MKSKSQYILLRNDKKIYSSHAAAKETLDRYEPEYRSKYKVVKIEEVSSQQELVLTPTKYPVEVLRIAELIATLLSNKTS